MKFFPGIVIALICVTSVFGQFDPRRRIAQLEAEVKSVTEERNALKVKLAQALLKIKNLESKLEKAEFIATSETKQDSDETEEQIDGGRDFQARVRVVSNTAPDLRQYDAKVRAQQTRLSIARSNLSSSQSRYNSMRQDNKDRIRFRDAPHSDTDLAKMRTQIKRQEYLAEAASSILQRYQRERARAASARVVNVTNLADNSVVQLHARGAILQTAQVMSPGREYMVEGKRMTSGIIILTRVSNAN